MPTDTVNAEPSVQQLTLSLKLQKETQKTEQKKRKAAEAIQKAEQEKRKAAEATQKAEQEKQKTLKLELQCKRAATYEDQGGKRFKGNVIISSEHLYSLHSSLTNDGFYNSVVANNIHRFEITDLLHNYNEVNKGMMDVIKENFDPFKSFKTITEDQIQTTFNKMLSDLFSQFNNSTSLKYLNTHNKPYLKGKASDDILSSKASDNSLPGRAPDCSFIYKNVNINVDDEHEALQDFVVCIGELKISKPRTVINGPHSVGQLMRYLTCILKVQQRGKVYGFITNINNIRFYYAEQGDNQSIVYYQSDEFEMFNYSPKTTTTTSSSSSVIQTGTSAPTRCYNEQALKLLIKFLTMDMKFYGYTTLNINTDDYLYNDKFYIKMRSGNGATSFVYLLANACDNQLANNPKCSIIKISKHEKYSKYFINEVNILRKLKESNNLKKFDLFFQNVCNSSPTGKFIFFETQLIKLKSLTLVQSIQLINAVEYLHNCHIIHRDIRPNNIMFNSNTEQIKLIDFGFATTVENNEITKELPIEGTISFGSLKFLKFYSEIAFNSSPNPQYEYERTFDLYCSLNVIVIMRNEYLKDQFYTIKHKQSQTTDEKIILDMYKFWFDLKMRNKGYSNLLKLCDNLKGPKDFESIVKNIDQLDICND